MGARKYCSTDTVAQFYDLTIRDWGIVEMVSLYAARDCANLQAFFNFLFWKVMATKKRQQNSVFRLSIVDG